MESSHPNQVASGEWDCFACGKRHDALADCPRTIEALKKELAEEPAEDAK